MPTFDPNQVVRYNVPAPSDEIAAFWTEERMKMAKPFAPRRGRKAGGRGGVQTGRQQAVPPATLELVSDVDALPYSTVGKLFFYDDEGLAYGTAWVMGPSIIATVGHNVGNAGENAPTWTRYMQFCPQYDTGVTPLGAYQMKTYFTLRGWIEGDNYEFDLALCLTTQPMPVNSTGTLGFQANVNLPRLYPVMGIGYPGGDGFQNQMYKSRGQFVYDTEPGDLMLASNRLGKGASGGPWVVVNQSGQMFANGINSLETDDDDGTWSSPYFGVGMNNLWAAAVRG